MLLRDILIKDWGWKVFSVALAIGIWLMVHTFSEVAARRVNSAGGLLTQTSQAVPVLVVSSTADVREFKVRPAAVQITVSGPPAAVTALDARQIRVLVDLTGIEAARDLKRRVEVSIPLDLTLVSAVPTEVDVVVPPKKGN